MGRIPAVHGELQATQNIFANKLRNRPATMCVSKSLPMRIWSVMKSDLSWWPMTLQ